MNKTTYIGRFAPSPTGPLHFGSLVAALASFLDARANQGQWLVRMEDIDPPREQPGAADLILQALDSYGMHWDGEVLYQSQRNDAYKAAINKLYDSGQLYACTCSRKELQPYEGVYPGLCRGQATIPDKPYALRVQCDDKEIIFDDLIQGSQTFSLPELGDFILQRKEKLYAYQLAVCVDDDYQDITHIVRGHDLLDSTPRQIYLQSVMTMHTPIYAHIPVITQPNGDKLSKQNLAPALPLDDPRPLLIKALVALGQKPPRDLRSSSAEDILQWGVNNWRLSNISHISSIPLAALSDTND